jgi:peptide/nickel transport system substrate-binding protein
MKKNLWRFLVSLVLTSMILTSCASSETSSVVPISTVTQSVDQESTQVEDQQTLVYATSELPLNMDPAFLPGEQTAEITQNLYGAWIYYKKIPCPGNSELMCDDTGSGEAGVEGGLFESWDISDDFMVYTMYLRKNIVDSYGNQLKAEDAKWIFERMKGTEAGSVYVLGALNLPDPSNQINVIDEFTLQFNLNAPNPVFLRVLNVNNGQPFGAATVRKNVTDGDPWGVEWMKRNAAATGPYMLEKWTPGVEVVLVKNPNYYGSPPPVDKLIYRQVPDSSNRVALLLNGEADIGRDFSMEEIDRINESPNAKAVCYAGNRFAWIALNWNESPTDNLLVRQALAYAVPYDDILNKVFRGFAKPLYGYVTEGYSDFLGKDAFPYETDFERAKDLLSQAGYPNGFDLPLVISEAYPTHERIAVLLKESFGKIGVNVLIERKPMAAYKDLTFNREAIASIDENYSFVLDPNYHAFVWLLDSPPPNFNTSGFADKDFNDLMDKGVAMPDGPERTALNEELQTKFYQLTPWLSLANTPTCFAFSNRVTGYAWHTHNQVMFFELDVAD